MTWNFFMMSFSLCLTSKKKWYKTTRLECKQVTLFTSYCTSLFCNSENLTWSTRM
jgi:hypothetical protein